MGVLTWSFGTLFSSSSSSEFESESESDSESSFPSPPILEAKAPSPVCFLFSQSLFPDFFSPLSLRFSFSDSSFFWDSIRSCSTPTKVMGKNFSAYIPARNIFLNFCKDFKAFSIASNKCTIHEKWNRHFPRERQLLSFKHQVGHIKSAGGFKLHTARKISCLKDGKISCRSLSWQFCLYISSCSVSYGLILRSWIERNLIFQFAEKRLINCSLLQPLYVNKSDRKSIPSI